MKSVTLCFCVNSHRLAMNPKLYGISFEIWYNRKSLAYSSFIGHYRVPLTVSAFFFTNRGTWFHQIRSFKVVIKSRI